MAEPKVPAASQEPGDAQTSQAPLTDAMSVGTPSGVSVQAAGAPAAPSPFSDWIGPAPRTDLASSSKGRAYLDLVLRDSAGPQGFWEAAKPGVQDLPFVGDVAAGVDLAKVPLTLHRIKNGQPVSDEDVIELNYFVKRSQREANRTWLGTVGAGIKGLFQFGAEFAATTALIGAGLLAAPATGGATAAGAVGAAAAVAGKKGVVKAAKEVAEAAVEKVVKEAAQKGVEVGAKRMAWTRSTAAFKGAQQEIGDKMRGIVVDAIGDKASAKVANVAGKVASGVAQMSAVGAAMLSVDEAVNVVAAGVTGDAPTTLGQVNREVEQVLSGKAVDHVSAKVFELGDRFVEYFSEVSGPFLGKAIGGVAKTVAPGATQVAVEWGQKFSKWADDMWGQGITKTAGELTEAGKTYVAQKKWRLAAGAYLGALSAKYGVDLEAAAGMFKAGGYDGFLPEMGEERLGGFIRGLTGIQGGDWGLRNAFDQMLPPIEDLATEAVVFATPLAMAGGLHLVHNTEWAGGQGIRGLYTNIRKAQQYSARSKEAVVTEEDAQQHADGILEIVEAQKKLEHAKDKKVFNGVVGWLRSLVRMDIMGMQYSGFDDAAEAHGMVAYVDAYDRAFAAAKQKRRDGTEPTDAEATEAARATIRKIVDLERQVAVVRARPEQQDTVAGSEDNPTVRAERFINENEFFRVIHGDAAFQDLLDTGQVRTNAGHKVAPGASLRDAIAARPTAFPSFSKGAAAMEYAQSSESHYIIVSADPAFRASSKEMGTGRHGKGSTYFIVDASGKPERSFSTSRVDVYKHLGGGRYRLVLARGKQLPDAVPAAAQRPSDTELAAKLNEAAQRGDLGLKVEEFGGRRMLTREPLQQDKLAQFIGTTAEIAEQVLQDMELNTATRTASQRSSAQATAHFGTAGISARDLTLAIDDGGRNPAIRANAMLALGLDPRRKDDVTTFETAAPFMKLAIAKAKARGLKLRLVGTTGIVRDTLPNLKKVFPGYLDAELQRSPSGENERGEPVFSVLAGALNAEGTVVVGVHDSLARGPQGQHRAGLYHWFEDLGLEAGLGRDPSVGALGMLRQALLNHLGAPGTSQGPETKKLLDTARAWLLGTPAQQREILVKYLSVPFMWRQDTGHGESSLALSAEVNALPSLEQLFASDVAALQALQAEVATALGSTSPDIQGNQVGDWKLALQEWSNPYATAQSGLKEVPDIPLASQGGALATGGKPQIILPSGGESDAQTQGQQEKEVLSRKGNAAPGAGTPPAPGAAPAPTQEEDNLPGLSDANMDNVRPEEQGAAGGSAAFGPDEMVDPAKQRRAAPGPQSSLATEVDAVEQRFAAARGIPIHWYTLKSLLLSDHDRAQEVRSSPGFVALWQQLQAATGDDLYPILRDIQDYTVQPATATGGRDPEDSDDAPEEAPAAQDQGFDVRKEQTRFWAQILRQLGVTPAQRTAVTKFLGQGVLRQAWNQGDEAAAAKFLRETAAKRQNPAEAKVLQEIAARLEETAEDGVKFDLGSLVSLDTMSGGRVVPHLAFIQAPGKDGRITVKEYTQDIRFDLEDRATRKVRGANLHLWRQRFLEARDNSARAARLTRLFDLPVADATSWIAVSPLLTAVVHYSKRTPQLDAVVKELSDKVVAALETWNSSSKDEVAQRAAENAIIAAFVAPIINRSTGAVLLPSVARRLSENLDPRLVKGKKERAFLEDLVGNPLRFLGPRSTITAYRQPSALQRALEARGHRVVVIAGGAVAKYVTNEAGEQERVTESYDGDGRFAMPAELLGAGFDALYAEAAASGKPSVLKWAGAFGENGTVIGFEDVLITEKNWRSKEIQDRVERYARWREAVPAGVRDALMFSADEVRGMAQRGDWRLVNAVLGMQYAQALVMGNPGDYTSNPAKFIAEYRKRLGLNLTPAYRFVPGVPGGLPDDIRTAVYEDPRATLPVVGRDGEKIEIKLTDGFSVFVGKAGQMARRSLGSMLVKSEHGTLKTLHKGVPADEFGTAFIGKESLSELDLLAQQFPDSVFSALRDRFNAMPEAERPHVVRFTTSAKNAPKSIISAAPQRGEQGWTVEAPKVFTLKLADMGFLFDPFQRPYAKPNDEPKQFRPGLGPVFLRNPGLRALAARLQQWHELSAGTALVASESSWTADVLRDLRGINEGGIDDPVVAALVARTRDISPHDQHHVAKFLATRYGDAAKDQWPQVKLVQVPSGGAPLYAGDRVVVRGDTLEVLPVGTAFGTEPPGTRVRPGSMAGNVAGVRRRGQYNFTDKGDLQDWMLEGDGDWANQRQDSEAAARRAAVLFMMRHPRYFEDYFQTAVVDGQRARKPGWNETLQRLANGTELTLEQMSEHVDAWDLDVVPHQGGFVAVIRGGAVAIMRIPSPGLATEHVVRLDDTLRGAANQAAVPDWLVAVLGSDFDVDSLHTIVPWQDGKLRYEVGLQGDEDKPNALRRAQNALLLGIREALTSDMLAFRLNNTRTDAEAYLGAAQQWRAVAAEGPRPPPLLSPAGALASRELMLQGERMLERAAAWIRTFNIASQAGLAFTGRHPAKQGEEITAENPFTRHAITTRFWDQDKEAWVTETREIKIGMAPGHWDRLPLAELLDHYNTMLNMATDFAKLDGALAYLTPLRDFPAANLLMALNPELREDGVRRYFDTVVGLLHSDAWVQGKLDLKWRIGAINDGFFGVSEFLGIPYQHAKGNLDVLAAGDTLERARNNQISVPPPRARKGETQGPPVTFFDTRAAFFRPDGGTNDIVPAHRAWVTRVQRAFHGTVGRTATGQRIMRAALERLQLLRSQGVSLKTMWRDMGMGRIDDRLAQVLVATALNPQGLSARQIVEEARQWFEGLPEGHTLKRFFELGAAYPGAPGIPGLRVQAALLQHAGFSEADMEMARAAFKELRPQEQQVLLRMAVTYHAPTQGGMVSGNWWWILPQDQLDPWIDSTNEEGERSPQSFWGQHNRWALSQLSEAELRAAQDFVLNPAARYYEVPQVAAPAAVPPAAPPTPPAALPFPVADLFDALTGEVGELAYELRPDGGVLAASPGDARRQAQALVDASSLSAADKASVKTALASAAPRGWPDNGEAPNASLATALMLDYSRALKGDDFGLRYGDPPELMARRDAFIAAVNDRQWDRALEMAQALPDNKYKERLLPRIRGARDRDAGVPPPTREEPKGPAQREFPPAPEASLSAPDSRQMFSRAFEQTLGRPYVAKPEDPALAADWQKQQPTEAQRREITQRIAVANSYAGLRAAPAAYQEEIRKDLLAEEAGEPDTGDARLSVIPGVAGAEEVAMSLDDAAEWMAVQATKLLPRGVQMLHGLLMREVAELNAVRKAAAMRYNDAALKFGTTRIPRDYIRVRNPDGTYGKQRVPWTPDQWEEARQYRGIVEALLEYFPSGTTQAQFSATLKALLKLRNVGRKYLHAGRERWIPSIVWGHAFKDSLGNEVKGEESFYDALQRWKNSGARATLQQAGRADLGSSDAEIEAALYAELKEAREFFDSAQKRLSWLVKYRGNYVPHIHGHGFASRSLTEAHDDVKRALDALPRGIAPETTLLNDARAYARDFTKGVPQAIQAQKDLFATLSPAVPPADWTLEDYNAAILHHLREQEITAALLARKNGTPYQGDERRLRTIKALEKALHNSKFREWTGRALERTAKGTRTEVFHELGYKPAGLDIDVAMHRYVNDAFAAAFNRALVGQMLLQTDATGAPLIVAVPSNIVETQELLPQDLLVAHARQVLGHYGYRLDPNRNARIQLQWAATNLVGRQNYAEVPSKFPSVSMFLAQKGAAEKVLLHVVGEPRQWLVGDVDVLEQLHRVTQWSKITSVGWSVFFPIALLESVVAGTGIRKNILWSPVRSAGEIKKVWREMNTPGSATRALEGLMTRAGIQLSEASALDEVHGVADRDVERVFDWVRRHHGEQAAIWARHALRTWQGRWLSERFFGDLFPAFKLWAAQRLMEESALQSGTDISTEAGKLAVLRRIAPIINDAYGGQFWDRYLWATPQVRQMLNLLMFAPNWTLSAWNIAGGGLLTGRALGNPMTAENTKFVFLQNWPAMAAVVMVAVPAALQLAIWALTRGAGDPDDKPFPLMNEVSRGDSIDITPVVRLMPGYEGDPTGRRRFYMRFGKQAQEVVGDSGWLFSPVSQLMRKLSQPARAVLEQLTGRSPGSDFALEFKGQGMLGWIKSQKPGFEGLQTSRLGYLASKFVPMSVLTWSKTPEAAVAAFIAPVSKGMSMGRATEALVKVLNTYANQEVMTQLEALQPAKANLDALAPAVLDAAARNGYDTKKVLDAARGVVMGRLYGEFWKALNANDTKAMDRLAVPILRLHGTLEGLAQSMANREKQFRRPLTPEQTQLAADVFNRAQNPIEGPSPE